MKLPSSGDVAQLQEQGILRDIKPANTTNEVLPSAKLADFGIPRLVDEPSTLTEPDGALGTPNTWRPR